MRDGVRTEVHVHQDSEKEKTSVVWEERQSLNIKDGPGLAGRPKGVRPEEHDRDLAGYGTDPSLGGRGARGNVLFLYPFLPFHCFHKILWCDDVHVINHFVGYPFLLSQTFLKGCPK